MATAHDTRATARAAAHAVAGDLTAVLQQLGSHGKAPRASAVRAASIERAKGRRGKAAAAVTAASAIRPGPSAPAQASAATTTSAPAAAGAMPKRSQTAPVTRAAAKQAPPTLATDGGTPRVAPGTVDRARRMLDLHSQHTDNADMDRVLQQVQKDAASQSPTGYVYHGGRSDDLSQQLKAMSQQLEALTAIVVSPRVDSDVIDDGASAPDVTASDTSGISDADGDDAARRRSRKLTRKKRVSARAKTPAARKRVTFSDKQSDGDSSDADFAKVANKAAVKRSHHRAPLVKDDVSRRKPNDDDSDDGNRRRRDRQNKPRGGGDGDGDGSPDDDEDDGSVTDDETPDTSDDDDVATKERHYKVRHDVKPRPFNGDGYVEQFLAQFQYTAALARWPKKDWGLQLITTLEGKARRVITEHHLPATGRPKYEQVAQLLRESFGSDATPDVWLTTLERRKRHDKETLSELSQAIMELVSKAFPNVNFDERQRIAVGYFVRALREQQHRVHTMATCPKSLHQALQVALAYENAERLGADDTRRQGHKQSKVMAYSEEEQDSFATAQCQHKGKKASKSAGSGDAYNDSPPRSAVSQQGSCDTNARGRGGYGRGQGKTAAAPSAETGLTQTVRTLAARIDAMQGQLQQLTGGRPTAAAPRAQSSARASQANGRCFNCDEEGHFKRDCPHPRNDQGRGNGRGRGANGQPHGQARQ